MPLSTLSAPAKRRRVAGEIPPWFLALLGDVGSEDGGANQQIYLITVSRVLPEVMASAGFRDVETLTRAELRDMVRDAFDDPVHLTSVGRPRACTESKVEVVIVAREYHADGSAHFYVVVKLNANMRFKQAKLTLRMRHKLPSHWSCTHRQLWSALRYLFVATPKKPVVDKDLLSWARDGRDLDLHELSKQPFLAKAWRLRREKAETEALVEVAMAGPRTSMTTTAATSRRTEPTPPRVRASRSAFLYIQYYRCGAFRAPSRRHDARTVVLQDSLCSFRRARHGAVSGLAAYSALRVPSGVSH